MLDHVSLDNLVLGRHITGSFQCVTTANGLDRNGLTGFWDGGSGDSFAFIPVAECTYPLLSRPQSPTVPDLA